MPGFYKKQLINSASLGGFAFPRDSPKHTNLLILPTVYRN